MKSDELVHSTEKHLLQNVGILRPAVFCGAGVQYHKNSISWYAASTKSYGNFYFISATKVIYSLFKS
jgi:hypothetical protein